MRANYKGISLGRLKFELNANELLLDYYLFKNDDYKDECPYFCISLDNCDYCSWVIFTGEDCIAKFSVHNLFDLRSSRETEFIELRISMLRDWIQKLKRVIRYRERKNGNSKNIWSWQKLIIDEKIIYVFPSSRVPRHIQKLTHLKGVELKDGTKEERKPFLILEKTRKE